MARKRFNITREFLVEHYLEKKLTILECADTFGCSSHAINNALKRHNIAPRAGSGVKITHISKQWLSEKYTDENLTIMECAKAAKCSSIVINRLLVEYEIPIHPSGTPRLKISKNWLLEHYVAEGLSMWQCATLFGCSIHSIQNALKSHEIAARPRMRFGNTNGQWRGGISFYPYCPKFNEALREEVREAYGRKCGFPGCECTEAENKERLSVHHINFDKQAGCFGKRFNLMPLCRKCHTATSHNRHYYFNLLINHWLAKYIDDFTF